MRSRAVLLTNQQAGSSDDAALHAVEQALAEADVAATLHRLGNDFDGPLDVAIERWADAEVTYAIAGGDGTVHHVVADLHRLGALDAARPLGLVPLGTGNDLARSAGIDLDPVAAARGLGRAMTARARRDGDAVDVRRLDVLLDDTDGVVVNAAHAGVGASASEAGADLKEHFGTLGYAVGAVLAGVRETGWPMRVEVDGRDVVGPDRPLLMVGLAIGSTIGGGAPLAPDAVVGDGAVDVVLVAATGPGARADFAPRLRLGSHGERDDVLITRGSTVTVEGAAAPLNVDGELVGEVGRRTWTMHPSAWSLLVDSHRGD